MIAYFDTAALIPLLIEEPGSDRAGRLWDAAHRVAAVPLVYPEARAALAQAVRVSRFDGAQLRPAVAALDDLYAQLDLIAIDDVLVRRAGALAEEHALRGYDAIHLAGAERIADDDTILVAGDRDLLRAARTLRLAVTDTSAG